MFVLKVFFFYENAFMYTLFNTIYKYKDTFLKNVSLYSNIGFVPCNNFMENFIIYDYNFQQIFLIPSCTNIMYLLLT